MTGTIKMAAYRAETELAALAGLCRLRNELPGCQTGFPGTRLRVVLEPPPVAE